MAVGDPRRTARNLVAIGRLLDLIYRHLAAAGIDLALPRNELWRPAEVAAVRSRTRPERVLELVDEADLTPDRLSCAIRRAIERGPGTISVQTGGARCAASLIGDMIRDPASVIRRQRDFMSRSPGIMIGG